MIIQKVWGIHIKCLQCVSVAGRRKREHFFKKPLLKKKEA